MNRSPWFNARTQPPVNGWLDDEYEQRCKAKRPPHSQDKPIDMAYRNWLLYDSCTHCEWRGLLTAAATSAEISRSPTAPL